MGQILGMAMPFFGLIFLGFLAARIRSIPRDGMAWMNFFIIYVALPALLFNLVSKTPLSEMANLGFIFATTLGTYIAFALAFCVGILATDGEVRQSTIQDHIHRVIQIRTLGVLTH